MRTMPDDEGMNSEPCLGQFRTMSRNGIANSGNDWGRWRNGQRLAIKFVKGIYLNVYLHLQITKC
jgi:hypothetical protein